MYTRIKSALGHGLMLIGLAGSWSGLAQAQTICTFDLGGASGDNYTFMKDYALAARNMGVNLVLKAYGNEAKALSDFKAGQCEGLLATSFVTREFNSYTGSINAIGAVPSNSVARNLLTLMGNPKLAGDMVEGNYEAAGIIPIGSAYFVTKDRSIDTLAKIEGKRIGVLEIDPVQRRMAAKVGAKPVLINIDTAGQKFQTNLIDILPAPPMAYSALEIYRSMGPNGGVAHFPLSLMTLNLIIKQEHFPTDFGQKSRTWFASQAGKLINQTIRYESAVPAKVWFEISAEEKVGYMQLLRQMRMEFVQNKTYNPKMMSLLKKLRCKQDSSSSECSLKGE